MESSDELVINLVFALAGVIDTETLDVTMTPFHNYTILFIFKY